MRSRTPRLLLCLTTIAGIAAGCADDHAATAPPATDAGPSLPGSGVTVEVDALDNRFEAPTLTIEAGTTVRFVNQGKNDHDVLPAEGDAWGASKEQFLPATEYSYVFDAPGTYPYYCSIHGTASGVGMAGTIEVTG